MRVMLSQINSTIGDIQGNIDKIIHGINEAKAQKAQLVVFPELAIVGYPPEDFLLLVHFIRDAEEALNKVIAASEGIAVIVGTVRRHNVIGEKSLSNSAAIIENGHLLGFQDKMLLPTYDVFDERRFFEPSKETHLWNIYGHSVGVTVCEDIWQHSELLQEVNYSSDPIKNLALLHPEFVVNLSASPFSCGKAGTRLKVYQKISKSLKCPFLLCNQVGSNDSLIFDGYSLCVNTEGRIVGRAKGFDEDNYLVDLSAIKDAPSIPLQDPMNDLYQALVLGVKDYFRKSSFTKACIGLSGGIDSALVACIAVEALGSENVVGVAMPSRYSSALSLKDASELADTLAIKLWNIPIEQPFCAFQEVLTPLFEGYQPDVTEENIQARIRGVLLMALSNKFKFIVLSTGNKSELAMGYSTLYGDMCGGLAVIADLTKNQVYSLSRWINRNREIIPLSSIEKPPSAELRPNQKDSDSLPDYDIIDNVLKSYIEEHTSPELIANHFGYPLQLVQDLIIKIHRNEFKRRQSPLGLRVSEKAFSVGRHFPIVQKYV